MNDVPTPRRRCWKRRSADIGGLHLATGNNGQGQGWIGDSEELQYVSFLMFLSPCRPSRLAHSLRSCWATCIMKLFMLLTSMAQNCTLASYCLTIWAYSAQYSHRPLDRDEVSTHPISRLLELRTTHAAGGGIGSVYVAVV